MKDAAIEAKAKAEAAIPDEIKKERAKVLEAGTGSPWDKNTTNTPDDSWELFCII